MKTVFLAILGLVRASDTTPEQIHLAFAGKDASGNPTGMRIAWYTDDKPGSPSTVRYGTTSGQYTSTVSDASSPFVYFHDHGYHHVVEVTGLTPSTTYYYVVGAEKGGWSSEFHFTTAPTGRAAETASIRLSIFGDHGWLDSKQRPQIIVKDGLERHWSAQFTHDRLIALQDQYDAIWHVGDIGYADDAFSHDPIIFEYEKCYNGYMNWMQRFSATKPYHVTPGNHESECHGLWCSVTKLWDKDNVLGNFSAFNARWHMPSVESGGHARSNMWYSWNWGPVHFISINTETDWPGAEEYDTGDSHDKKMPAGHFGAPGEYLRWFEDDLKAAVAVREQAKKGLGGQRWIVVGGHRPYKDIEGVHTDLMAKYGPDMYFAGHMHSYARSAPINGTVYITTGGAGCEEMAMPKDNDVDAMLTCDNSPRQGNCSGKAYPTPLGTGQYATDRMSVGILNADPHQLKWQLYDSQKGNVLDSVVVTADEAVIV